MTRRTPYDKIDPPVRGLVRVLNRFPGIKTYTSCGGHPEPAYDSQAAEGYWYVDFNVDRNDEGWISLEFFGWVAYGVAPDGVELNVLSKPPFLNFPGSMLFFRWAGLDPTGPDCTADAFAELLQDARRKYYVTAHQASRWPI
jgi:hypothetical protein